MKEEYSQIKIIKIENHEKGIDEAEQAANEFMKGIKRVNGVHCWPMVQLYSGKLVIIYRSESEQTNN